MNLPDKVKKGLTGAQEILIGTLRNMDPRQIPNRLAAEDQARRESNTRMIENAFPGGLAQYEEILASQTPEEQALFKPPYADAMQSFMDRILQARNGMGN
jgi:hypothetical protein